MRFCHQRRRVKEINVSKDHRIYGIYNFYMKFDHESVQQGFYNFRNWGDRSGYFVRAKFYFLYCYDPTRSFCPKTYILYLRNYVHADGTSSMFRTMLG